MTEDKKKFIIRRPIKRHRNSKVSFEATEQEKDLMAQTKKWLRFSSACNFFLFCNHVVEQLYSLHNQGYRFFIRKNDEEEYQEVGFEFQPKGKKS